MATLIRLKRRYKKRRNLTRLALSQILSGKGTSVGTAVVNGRFGMIGKSVGTSSATGRADLMTGHAIGTSVVTGVMNAGSMIGQIVGQTLVTGIINAAAVAPQIKTTTVVSGRSGSQGIAIGASGSMATGITYVDDLADINDFAGRIKSLLPPSWFQYSNGAPVLSIPVFGMAYGLLWIYELYLYTLANARIKTAIGIWLDRISYDFLGNNLPRLTSESDDDYRVRIIAAILAPKQTRAAISQALDQLTGNEPQIIELFNPGDTGVYGTSGSNGAGTMGYGIAGMYGSLSFPNQFLVNAFRPTGEGIPVIPGYGNPVWGYGATNNGEYSDLNDIVGKVKDSDIYANIAATIGAGNTAWTTIATPPDTVDAPTAYFGNVNNSSLAAVMFGGFFF